MLKGSIIEVYARLKLRSVISQIIKYYRFIVQYLGDMMGQSLSWNRLKNAY